MSEDASDKKNSGNDGSEVSFREFTNTPTKASHHTARMDCNKQEGKSELNIVVEEHREQEKIKPVSSETASANRQGYFSGVKNSSLISTTCQKPKETNELDSLRKPIFSSSSASGTQFFFSHQSKNTFSQNSLDLTTNAQTTDSCKIISGSVGKGAISNFMLKKSTDRQRVSRYS